MHEKFAIDRRQTLEDVGPAREFRAHPQKSANDIDTHAHSGDTVEQYCRHDRTVFGISPRQ